MTGRTPSANDNQDRSQAFSLCAASEEEIEEAKNVAMSRAYKNSTVELETVRSDLSVPRLLAIPIWCALQCRVVTK